ncbi:MAG: DUF2628 domain-containing protein [Candidatus Kaistia colombiensis]|nr:MAG: DUF2628 domain-containing protein [Kaistia sp.]
MTTYTVHAPPVSATGGMREAERMVFVRDGFCWAAFVIPVIWMLYRRLWIVLCLYALFAVAIELAGRTLGAPTATALGILGALYLGFEGNTLRRWSLARRRFTERGLADGRSLDEAEIRFFHRPAGVTPAGADPVAVGVAAGPATRPSFSADIVGLFPTPGTTR